MTSVAQLPLDEQHKKIEKELQRLRDSSPLDAIDLGNYWINILNEKQQSKKAADIILLTATNYYRLGNYTTNLQYLQTARSLYKKLDDERGEAMSIRDMGFTFRKMGQNQDAYEYLESSIHSFEKMKDYAELATTYNFMEIGRASCRERV